MMRQFKISKEASITSKDDSSLVKYLQEIGKIELITAEQEVDLVKKIKQGDENAIEELTNANLRFVVSVAKQYQNQGISLPDLINEGNLGMIKAAKRFDEKRGFKFISYAVWWIRQSILQAIGNDSKTIRLPLNKGSLISKYKKAITALTQEYEREPSISEIALKMEITEDKVKEIIDIIFSNQKPASISDPINGEEDFTLGDLIANSNSEPTDHLFDQEVQRTELEKCLDIISIELDGSGYKIEAFYHYYGLRGFSKLDNYAEIARELNITSEKVRSTQGIVCRMLKTKFSYLKNYL